MGNIRSHDLMRLVLDYMYTEHMDNTVSLTRATSSTYFRISSQLAKCWTILDGSAHVLLRA